MRRRWVAISAALFVGLLIVGIALGLTFDKPKSFSLPRVRIDATMQPDGTMRVVEHLTYDFTGSFTYGTRPIPPGPYTITDVSVSEHGRPLTSVGAPYALQWFFSAQDEQRTFDVAYTVNGAVTAAPDVGVLYWKWVGENHPTIDHVQAVLRVPAGPGRLRAWGHGPLDGRVHVGADTVSWRAPEVPQGTYVEGRVAIPTARLPGVPVVGPPQLPGILTQERAWARAANLTRRQAAEEAQRERDARDALQVVAPIAAALALLGFLLVWWHWGREPAVPDDIGEYVRDLPDDPPAVVDALMHWGAVRPNAFGATVIDLAQRGYLTIAEQHIDRGVLPDRTDYEFTRKDPPADAPELKGFEEKALEQVFAAGPVTTQSEMTKFARAHQSESAARWESFKSSAHKSLQGRAYIHGGRGAPFFLNILMVLIVGGLGVAALALQAWVGGAIALAAAAVQLSLTPLLRQRTAAGQRRYHEWLGVRRFLTDFSQLADAPAGHLVLWERYLVYAVALGVSDELARGLATRLPAEQTATFAPWYVAHLGTPGYGGIGDFSHGFATSAVASFTPASSSSGSGFGGGFSGGGGGGGGGGGIGAG